MQAHLQGRPGAERKACTQRSHHLPLGKAADVRVHRRGGHQFQTGGTGGSRVLSRVLRRACQVSRCAQELREPERHCACRLQCRKEGGHLMRRRRVWDSQLLGTLRDELGVQTARGRRSCEVRLTSGCGLHTRISPACVSPGGGDRHAHLVHSSTRRHSSRTAPPASGISVDAKAVLLPAPCYGPVARDTLTRRGIAPAGASGAAKAPVSDDVTRGMCRDTAFLGSSPGSSVVFTFTW